MLIKIIGDAAIAMSGMRKAICGLECEGDRILGWKGRSHFISFSQRAGDRTTQSSQTAF
ncbi:hypothetical protein QUB37_09645 [Microcoleus sp. AT3-A2]|uniref:hypothetical protein n=1 Tax=unclassified Microcoleus TaxID=2642155 RepID=UPI002FCF89C8